MIPYRYRQFERAVMKDDNEFCPSPGPGDPLPAFDMITTDGTRVRKEDFIGRKLFITIGSITCPMTASAAPALKHLHREFADRVAFLTVYVREAHPGSRYPQPATLDEKLAHAQAYVRRDRIPWTVAVDDVEGSFHRSLDPKPNTAYFVGGDGRIVFRALWSNDETGLRRGFDDLLSPFPHFQSDEHERDTVAKLRGLGMMDEVLAAAGDEAQRDFRRAMPVVHALAKLARLFRPLPPLGRSIAAIATLGLAVITGVAVAQRARRA
jgi:hypothetical protein